MFEFLRSEYLIDMWHVLTFGLMGSHFFLFFVLTFPLMVSLAYLLFYLGGKILPFNYSLFYYIKESVVLFSFLYFFFFILILIDFLYYVELHKVFFSLSENEMAKFLTFKK